MDCVVHQGSEQTETKLLIEQKRLEDQKDCPFTGGGARSQTEVGKGGEIDEVDIAVIDCPWNLRKERQK